MMDRTSLIAGGAIVALCAIWRLHAPEEQSTPSPNPNNWHEPAELNLHGVALRRIPTEPLPQVVNTAFPASGAEKEPESGPVLFSPAELTPQLSTGLPGQTQKENPLPSQSATPDPIEAPDFSLKLAPVDPRYVESIPLSARPQQQEVAVQQVPVAATPAMSQRSPRVAAAVERANKLSASGLRLAERGALFSARTEFLAALGQFADAHDETQSTARHRRALNAAQLAIEESNDFDASRNTSQEGIDLPTVIASHRTVVLKQADLSDMNSSMARDRYLQFAVEQLSLAVENDPAASRPFYALGRVNAKIAESEAQHGMTGSNTAAVWYHAALLADGRNFGAAHELGTFYAKRGDWQAARDVYRRAVALQSHPTTWANLAKVHAKLGEHDLASAALAQAGPNASTPKANLPPVEWVDPSTFAKTSGPNEAYLAQKSAPAAQPTGAAGESVPKSAAKPKSTSWFPFSTKRR